MVTVNFKEVDKDDSCDYVFVDSRNNKYHMFSDGRGHGIAGASPDFWDEFYFCEEIIVDYHDDEGIRVINRVFYYK